MPSVQGFTLVELAIVMTIVGILIGGILKGEEMIMRARALATIEQVQAFDAATNTFVDKYGQLPGDMSTATNRLPGCTNADGCFDGNGDYQLMPNRNWLGTYPNINSERTQFWRHLAIADLLSGIATSGTTIDWGASHPAAKIGKGGFHIARVNHNVIGRNAAFYYRLQPSASVKPDNPPFGPGDYAITPRWSLYIDTKMDDGYLGTGQVWDSSPLNSGGGGIDYCDPDQFINQANCLLFFAGRAE